MTFSTELGWSYLDSEQAKYSADFDLEILQQLVVGAAWRYL